MQTLAKEEVFTWCRQRSVKVTDDGHLFFDARDRRCIAIDLPEKPYTLVALANALLPYGQSAPFEGALLWIRQWGVWDELVERAGLRVMEVTRRIHGITRPLKESPGHLFAPQELIDLQACFVQPLLIGWDAFLVPSSGDYIVATSHDETTCVLSRTRQVHQQLLRELRPWGPREDEEWYFRGIGLPTDHG